MEGTVTAMTKREQKVELLGEMEDGMIWLVMGETRLIAKPLRQLLYAICKAIYVLLEQDLKGR
jgi:hypothetical protein